MLEQPPRRHPVQTFQFWFIVLCSFSVVTAWKLDLFLVSSPSESTAIVLDDEPMPPPPETGIQRVAAVPATLGKLSAEPIISAGNETADTGLAPAQLERSSLPPGNGIEMASYEQPSSGSGVVTADLASVESTGQIEQAVVRTAYVRQIPRENVSPAIPAEGATGSVTAHKGMGTPAAEINLQKLEHLMATGQDVAALRLCSSWYWSHPERRRQFQKPLNSLAARVYFQPEPHYLPPHIVQFGETLESIAGRYQLTPQYLKRLNRVEPIQLRVGQPLKVLQGPFCAVVDLSDKELTVHAQGYYLIQFPVGFGDSMQLPPGRYHVTEKSLGPEGAGNADTSLASRWLALGNETGSLTQQGIHGISDDSLVGQTGGPGCIRVTQRDIDVLFDLMVKGAEVVVKP